jgi:hypothetical protein
LVAFFAGAAFFLSAVVTGLAGAAFFLSGVDTVLAGAAAFLSGVVADLLGATAFLSGVVVDLLGATAFLSEGVVDWLVGFVFVSGAATFLPDAAGSLAVVEIAFDELDSCLSATIEIWPAFSVCSVEAVAVVSFSPTGSVQLSEGAMNNAPTNKQTSESFDESNPEIPAFFCILFSFFGQLIGYFYIL